MSFLKVEHDLPSFSPDVIFNIGSFPVASTTLYLVFIAVSLLVIMSLFSKRLQVIPGQAQLTVEAIYDWVVNLVSGITRNEERTKLILPAIGSIFTFILISNFAGVIPGLTAITYDHDAIFRGPTSDFNTTFALAFGSVLAINIASVKELGFATYFNKFIKIGGVIKGFSKGISAGLMSLVDLFIGLLELVGEITKVASLAFRLFGNMFAGKVLMTILLGFFAYGVPALWLAMETLAIVVQTVVFTALVATFYALAVEHDEH